MRNVCGCMPASSAATEITYRARDSARGSASIGSPLARIGIAGRARACVTVREHRRARVLVEHLRERFDGFPLLVVQRGRHLHVDRDQQVAAALAARTLAVRVDAL